MQIKLAALSLAVAAATGSAVAAEGPVPQGIPHLDHVFVIMMENHAYGQIINNPQAPFINSYAKNANLATNYFAVAHPSLTNYLEATGGSNFGVLDDNNPDWHNGACQTNLSTGTPSLESVSTPICPIHGAGTDAATPLEDYTNETSGNPSDPTTGVIEVDLKHTYPALTNVTAKTIADQLAERGMSWKSYQESLPISGADNVNSADGFFSNLTNFSTLNQGLSPSQQFSGGSIVALYAVKHNPFVYFRSVQEGTIPGSSLKNTAGFEGAGGLFADLASGHVPNYSFIAPNQCDDMHGRGVPPAVPTCNYDFNDNGTQNGLNPALIYQGDVTVERIVNAIHASPVWRDGRSAIITVWDENDYSIYPTKNQVVTIVDTNFGPQGKQSGKFYTHFSLLKSVESGLGLPCLNHACDKDTHVMADLFGGWDHDGDGWN